MQTGQWRWFFKSRVQLNNHSQRLLSASSTRSLLHFIISTARFESSRVQLGTIYTCYNGKVADYECRSGFWELNYFWNSFSAMIFINTICYTLNQGLYRNYSLLEQRRFVFREKIHSSHTRNNGLRPYVEFLDTRLQPESTIMGHMTHKYSHETIKFLLLQNSS